VSKVCTIAVLQTLVILSFLGDFINTSIIILLHQPPYNLSLKTYTQLPNNYIILQTF